MNGWSLERRARQASAIRRWRPWERATGPRTVDGKARSARNADRGGQRRQWRQLVKVLNAVLGTSVKWRTGYVAHDLQGVDSYRVESCAMRALSR